MNKSYAELCTEDRRLVILRFLAEEPDYRLNTCLLQAALESVGHRASRDLVNADAAWLRELDLVCHEAAGEVLVLKLTARGLDVVQGRAVVPGVKRPGPAG